MCPNHLEKGICQNSVKRRLGVAVARGAAVGGDDLLLVGSHTSQLSQHLGRRAQPPTNAWVEFRQSQKSISGPNDVGLIG
jgi:hypothetical protein